MGDDLLTRLRKPCSLCDCCKDCERAMDESAEEIERLQADLKAVTSTAQRETDTLRAERDEARQYIKDVYDQAAQFDWNNPVARDLRENYPWLEEMDDG